MDIDETDGGVPASVTFLSLAGTALPATVQALAIESVADGADAVRIRLAMPWAVFEQALADEAFNLFAHVLPRADIVRLSSVHPVVIDARLRSVAAQAFLESERASLSDIPAHIATTELLRRADSWLALTVTQPLDMAADAGPGAHAAVGCETAWNRPPTASATPVPMAGVALPALRERGHEVETLEPGLFRVHVRERGHEFVLLVLVDENERCCSCWSVYPRLASGDQRAAVAAFLMGVNYDLSVGNFELDAEDGEIRFRTSLDAGKAVFDRALFEPLLEHNLQAMHQIWPMLATYFGR